MRAIIALAALCVALPASAQAPCGPSDKVLPLIENNKYKERPVFEGATQTGAFITLYLNQQTGSWTMVAVNPESNMACITSGGMKSHVLEALHPGEPT